MCTSLIKEKKKTNIEDLVLLRLILWHINYRRLLMPNPFYTYKQFYFEKIQFSLRKQILYKQFSISMQFKMSKPSYFKQISLT